MIWLAPRLEPPTCDGVAHLLLQGLQGFELQAGQPDLNVFGNVWDQEAQQELEGQQDVLKAQERKKNRRSGVGNTHTHTPAGGQPAASISPPA